MKKNLPITVIIPSYNCIERVARHLKQAECWLGDVAEIIVVDSFSNDGTYEVLQSSLSHHNHARLIQCPPGLYQSWNRAVMEANQPYIYFSTIGDSLEAEGLEQLYHCISSNNLDVVVSPPEFKAPSDVQPAPWPVHEIIQAYGLTEPTPIPSSLLAALSLYYLSSSVLGSSASNIYRSDILKNSPFPTDYGRAGDSAWLIKNSTKINLAILPQCFSTFLIHEQDDPIQKMSAKTTHLKCAYLAYESYLELTGLTASECKEVAQNLCDFEDKPLTGDLFREYSDRAKQLKDPGQQLTLLCLIDSVYIIYHKQRFNQYKKEIGPLRYGHPSALYHRRMRKRMKLQLASRLISPLALEILKGAR